MEVDTLRRRSVMRTRLMCAALIAGIFWILWIAERGKERDRAMIAAVKRHDVPTMLALLKAGADPNVREQTLPTPSLYQRVLDAWHGTGWVPQRHNLGPPPLWVELGSTLDAPPDLILPKTPNAVVVAALLRHGAQLTLENPDDRMGFRIESARGEKEGVGIAVSFYSGSPPGSPSLHRIPATPAQAAEILALLKRAGVPVHE